MTNLARILRPMVALAACTAVALVTACETTPAAPASTVVVPVPPPVPERPWTAGELTYRPCAVLDTADTARFVLEPAGAPATPPNTLPECVWSSIQNSPAGFFTVRFSPNANDRTGSDRPGPDEQRITLGGKAALVAAGDRYPDGTHGGCAVDVELASGGSFAVGVTAGGIETGVAWDPCPKAVEIAGVIAGKVH